MDISIKMIFQVGLLDRWIGSSAGSLWRLLTCSRRDLTVPVPWHRPTGSTQLGRRHQGSLLGKYEEKYGEIMRNRKSEIFPMAAWDISWMIWWVTSHNVSGKRGHIASLSFGLRWALCQEGPLYPRWSQPRLRKNFGARWWAQVLMAEKCSTSLL